MKKVFILDDNEELLEIMERLLAQDYLVKCSPDAESVVQTVTEFDPHLMLLDHSVGEISSTDILSRLKAANINAPVILFSAHPMLADLAKLIGADGYIDKPSDINYIRNYIKSKVGDAS